MIDGLVEKDQKAEVQGNIKALNERFPDSVRPEIHEAMLKLGKQMQENPDDQALGLDLVYKAAAFDEIPQMLDKLVAEKINAMSDKEKELLISKGLGSGDSAGGGGDSRVETTMREMQKQEFGV